MDSEECQQKGDTRGDTRARNGQEEKRWRREGVRSRGRNGNRRVEKEKGKKDMGVNH